MKPIFGFDLTENKKSEITYSDLFVHKKTDDDLITLHDEQSEALVTLLNTAKLPILLRIIRYVGLFFGGGILLALFTVDGGFLAGVRNSPLIALLAIIGFGAGIALAIFSAMRNKRILTEENATEKIAALRKTTEIMYTELGVPSNADTVDLLIFNYRFKNGRLKMNTFVNPIMKVYVEDYELRIADIATLYSFPLESLKAINRINKRALIPGWNKDVPFNQGEYKQYKMSSNDYGIFCKPYYILELIKNGESYSIYFPAYELPVFERLTLMKANDDARENGETCEDGEK